MSEGARESRRLKRRYLLLGIFLLLLVASHFVRLFQPAEGNLLPGQVRIAVTEWERDTPTGREIQLAYRDLPAANGSADTPVLVLIHGSPLASRAMNGLIPHLNDGYRLIIPDLPGFGGSTIDIADYSTRAHAHNILELMDQLGVERAHLLAYSQGGGVILNMADIAPERVESLIMLSAIGVQELELLGDYTLNHGLYGVQLLGLKLLQEGFPHFGYMDDGLLNVAYARNFWDTDQRPLRGILQAYEGPMLIIHGEGDLFVPAAAAEEHHRIVPQSELVMMDGGHMLPFGQAEETSGHVRNFIDRAKDGLTKVKQYASPKRMMKAIAEMPADRKAATGETLWFYMGLLVLGTQLAEDLTCIAGGLLASRNIIGFWPVTIACIVGIFIGDMLLYLAGRYFGRPALRRAPLKWFLKERDVDAMQEWFHQRGAAIILGSRFVPGSRLPAYFSAGVLHIPMQKFIFYFMLAAVVWTPILVGLAYALGDVFLNYFERFEKYAIVGLLGLVAFILLFVHVVIPLFSWRGRRRLYGRWRRWVCWEYWPRWLFYPPVFCYVVWVGFTRRHLGLFTATNPGMGLDSGFTGESKLEILQKLSGAGDAVAAWTGIASDLDIGQKLQRLDAFMQREGLDFPIVLKPDIGERGSGVAIVRDRAAAETYLATCPDDIIAQRFVPGLEYGIFYVRQPDEEQGRIFGITDKRFASVTGDGKHTLEELILTDDRAICMRKFYESKHGDHLSDIIPAGETYWLTELGTHCRGSIFLDGSHLVTEELRAWMQRVSDTYEGFYFGRYDMRVPSVEDLQAGRNIAIIELNGISSEATWIYDPKHSVFYGWKTIIKQWQMALDIATYNRAHGHPPQTHWKTIRAIAQRWVREPFEA